MTCTAPGCNLVRGHGVRHSESADAGSTTWMDLRPTSGKAELHLTLACDLDCSACNRASFLRKPHTEPMTIADLHEFFAQADALCWKPALTLVGGEPTLHPQFQEFVRLCVAWAGRQRVHVWSNFYRQTARNLVQMSRRAGASAPPDTWKQDGARRGPRDANDYWVDDTFVSPADYGLTRDPCFQHQSVICGASVDHEGYAPCAMGGTMASLLGVPCRTRRLADLFDKQKVAEMTRAMCAACGHQWSGQRMDTSTLPRRFDTPMSPTWEKAFRDKR